MSINQAVQSLSARVQELKPIIETEEATKTAFIIPFISTVLGYDVTDPREVIPEYTADVGVKKGEKVDFAGQVLGSGVSVFESGVSFMAVV